MVVFGRNKSTGASRVRPREIDRLSSYDRVSSHAGGSRSARVLIHAGGCHRCAAEECESDQKIGRVAAHGALIALTVTGMVL